MIAVFSVIYDRFKEKIAKKMRKKVRKKSPGLSREILIKGLFFHLFQLPDLVIVLGDGTVG